MPQESCSSPCTSNPGTRDPAYCASEVLEEGKTSRPKDVWPFGCILIDILQWVLVVLIPHQISSSLRERRRPILRIFGFWYKDPDSIKVLLNPLVWECLAHLRDKTKEDTVFSGVYILMSRMTLPNPRQRPHTGEICNDLAALLKASDSRQSEPYPV
jgi:hypothetical protein